MLEIKNLLTYYNLSKMFSFQSVVIFLSDCPCELPVDYLHSLLNGLWGIEISGDLLCKIFGLYLVKLYFSNLEKI